MPRYIEAKSILNVQKKRDSWFLGDYSLNPYSGCSFNCLYCYIRGSKYGLNMETSLSVKVNAVELLEKRLLSLSKKGKHGFIVLASATDPYLQFEKEEKLTRRLLEVILKYRFPVHIITKSDLVVRDFDILQRIGEKAILPEDLSQSLNSGSIITFSFSSVDDGFSKIFEPGATPPSQRLKALQKAGDEGFKTGVSMMPMLPFISDTSDSLDTMFEAFTDHGAQYVMPATITLFGNEKSDSKTLVLRAVQKHYPDLLPKYQRFFANSNELPEYYQKAFHAKMEEMAVMYKMPDRIVKY